MSCLSPTSPKTTHMSHTPTEEIEVLNNYTSDDDNTASNSGGSNSSYSEVDVQDCKSIRDKKQPNRMTSGECVC